MNSEKHKWFIDSIYNSYLDARKIKFPSAKNKINRGTSHSISSVAEDLFAKYCADILPSNSSIQILIDPQISFTGSGFMNNSGKRPLLFRPDVCITVDNFITKVFDIKTDLGYKRNEITEQVKVLDTLIEKIKGLDCYLKIDKINNLKEKFKISEDIKMVIVVISGASNSGNIEKTVEIISKNTKTEMLVLSKGQSINHYENTNRFIVNEADFNKLDKIITE